MDHEHFMRLALAAAENCSDIVWYGVGCVIVSPAGEVVATGYTNEWQDEDGKGRHAEDCAIHKARAAGYDLSDAIIYSTLEPCSVRASGKTACVERIVAAKCGMVVYGAREPYDPALGIICEGHRKLEEAGLAVVELDSLAAECAAAALSKRSATPLVFE